MLAASGHQGDFFILEKWAADSGISIHASALYFQERIRSQELWQKFLEFPVTAYGRDLLFELFKAV